MARRVDEAGGGHDQRNFLVYCSQIFIPCLYDIEGQPLPGGHYITLHRYN